MKATTRREFDVVAAGSVCRLSRSLVDLLGLLGDLQARGVDLYLHQQALDTSTPSGRALFGMLGVFAEFERAMVTDRVKAGLRRTVELHGTRLGRPPISEAKLKKMRSALMAGKGIRETARLTKVSPAKVTKVRKAMTVTGVAI
jgi:DNA invertase Pin-like site-specific DNA recombinase